MELSVGIAGVVFIRGVFRGCDRCFGSFFGTGLGGCVGVFGLAGVGALLFGRGCVLGIVAVDTVGSGFVVVGGFFFDGSGTIGGRLGEIFGFALGCSALLFG